MLIINRLYQVSCVYRKNKYRPCCFLISTRVQLTRAAQLIGALKGDMARRTIRTKRKIARSRLPLQQQLGLDTEGRYFDLRGLFNKLNARHFGNRLRGYKVVWGRKRRERPKEYFIFGTIQEEDRVIRINPWLDQRFVPLWFLEYILYHEMLHAVVPDKVRDDGRRCVHTDEFNRREREFRFYKRARRWEEENLARFLR